jgi:hypothetical protein
LYTEHDVGIDYAHHELGDTLRRLGIGINIFEGADHDVSRRSDQARLIELFRGYLRQVAARQEPITATSTSINYKP